MALGIGCKGSRCSALMYKYKSHKSHGGACFFGKERDRAVALGSPFTIKETQGIAWGHFRSTSALRLVFPPTTL